MFLHSFFLVIFVFVCLSYPYPLICSLYPHISLYALYFCPSLLILNLKRLAFEIRKIGKKMFQSKFGSARKKMFPSCLKIIAWKKTNYSTTYIKNVLFETEYYRRPPQTRPRIFLSAQTWPRIFLSVRPGSKLFFGLAQKNFVCWLKSMFVSTRLGPKYFVSARVRGKNFV